MACENSNIEAAAREYLARQRRTTNPAGMFDEAGHWHPEDAEICGCCKVIRKPSKAWPLSWNAHCRTAGHVAQLFRVNLTDMRREARRLAASEISRAVALANARLDPSVAVKNKVCNS